MDIYHLVSENLTGLGGPMGSEFTTINWTKEFTSVEAAMDWAEEDFKKPIEWLKEKNEIRSKDLLQVMYHIKKRE